VWEHLVQQHIFKPLVPIITKGLREHTDITGLTGLRESPPLEQFPPLSGDATPMLPVPLWAEDCGWRLTARRKKCSHKAISQQLHYLHPLGTTSVDSSSVVTAL